MVVTAIREDPGSIPGYPIFFVFGVSQRVYSCQPLATWIEASSWSRRQSRPRCSVPAVWNTSISALSCVWGRLPVTAPGVGHGSNSNLQKPPNLLSSIIAAWLRLRAFEESVCLPSFPVVERLLLWTLPHAGRRQRKRMSQPPLRCGAQQPTTHTARAGTT